MNKRIRKKHRTAEFTEHGFVLEFTFADGTAEKARDAFLEALVSEVESRGLIFGGGGGDSWHGFIAHAADRGRGTVTPEVRAELEAWLAARKELASFTAGPLVDAWNELPLAFVPPDQG